MELPPAPPSSRLKLYLDTSVFGALFDSEPWRRSASLGVLDRVGRGVHSGYVSPVLFEEIVRAPPGIREGLERSVADASPTLLDESPETLALAQAYVLAGLVPERFRDDARHVAVASAYALDAVVSWNYRHMVSVVKRRLVHAVNGMHGYRLIDIVSPLELEGSP